jgi:hypothetical protein
MTHGSTLPAIPATDGSNQSKFTSASPARFNANDRGPGKYFLSLARIDPMTAAVGLELTLWSVNRNTKSRS